MQNLLKLESLTTRFLNVSRLWSAGLEDTFVVHGIGNGRNIYGREEREVYYVYILKILDSV